MQTKLVNECPNNLAKGRITVLSSLAAANEFVRFCPHLIHGSFDPHKSAPNGLAVFAQHTRVPNTQTQTDTQTTLRATSVAIGRIYAMHAIWPKTCYDQSHWWQ